MSNSKGDLMEGLTRCVKIRTLLLISLLSLQWLVPASATTTCTVFDLMPSFWQALVGKDSAAQMRTAVIDPHPDLYNDNYVRLPTAAKWVEKLAHEKKYDEAHRPEITATEHYLAANVPGPPLRWSDYH